VARLREIVALALVAVAAATQLPQAGWNAGAHYALVESLADGTPSIDGHLNQSGDIAYVDGHYYAAKSPGLAVFSLPLYLAYDAAGVIPAKQEANSGPPGAEAVAERAIWQINLLVVAVFFGLLVLIRATVDRFFPGAGVVTAVMLGLGTMLLPFAAAYFSHVVSAALGFAAFALLSRERQRPSETTLVAAGVLGGLAVFTELPLAVVTLSLGVYASARTPSLRRGALYGAGVLAGLVPLGIYNAWAFGAPWRNGYSQAVEWLGTSGHDIIGANDEGFFGLTHPRLGVAIDLLFSERGLFVLMPITLVALAGLPLLLRRGHRSEALLVGGLAAAMLVYNSAYYLPFGGGTPGPRFLVPLLPFLALPLAAAYSAWPRVTLAAGAVSAFWMISAIVAGPLLAEDLSPASWVGDILHEHELANSVLVNGRVSLLVLLAPAALAVALAAWSRAARPRLSAYPSSSATTARGSESRTTANPASRNSASGPVQSSSGSDPSRRG
jgi:hypothetical protein